MRVNSNLFSSILNYFFAVDVPWQFRLLVVMVLIFFGGGLFLNYQASLISLPGLSVGQHTPEYDKMLVDFTLEKHKALSASANLLYDFSKIALGALIASITQIYTKKGIKINQEQRKDSDNA